MSNVVVSVIMPAYNAEKFIKESIQSVIEQSYEKWELIVVDDGSTDDTAYAVKLMQASEPRIKYLYQENGRQGKARNTGIKNSTGEFVAFLDADDLWKRDKLERQMKSIADTKADLVFSGWSMFTTTPKMENKKNLYTGYFSGSEGLAKFLVNNYIAILTVLVKRSAITDVFFFSENPKIQNAEDYHLWLKLLAAGFTLWGSPDLLAHYRLHNKSSSSADRQVIFQALNGLKELAIEYPAREEMIRSAFLRRIDNYISQNNITEWSVVERLLELRATITGTPSFLLWRKVAHRTFGKRLFRYAYKWCHPDSDQFVGNLSLSQLSI